ncbi:4-alpha-glucanotransferase [Pontibacter sp. SGAir0037]|uniref:4-alpha-glucanotransferase n=1 Tax=Pontibacter sp. SGAir0037 TaxID=2571030 RepID=UPI0010CD5CA3|nr:4-alpha-glucanotransferase [Pontibacter sp. SGAir0037]QCR22799.1 4-alpha-glucanotransferase [Pontibacter sp. SGAir0037]
MIVHRRSSGVLLHITSLPSKYGIGDLGPEAYQFADLLWEAGQRYWQILPLNPTEEGSGNSPYSSHSAFAGNPLMISPDLLIEEGLLEKTDLKTSENFEDDRVDYQKATAYKRTIWLKAYENFKSRGTEKQQRDFQVFKQDHSAWLQDYSYFVVFKSHFGQKSWVEWDEAIKKREPEAVQQLASELADEIEREQFLQFLFYQQWNRLKYYCTGRDITFIGDMPFYVSHDSADVWSHPQNFKLDEGGMPTAVSGVPPDFFSETGQLWGTPVFDWQELARHNYDWWILRIEHNLALFGLLRLDHFRAFSAYWEVPAGEETAINGKWEKSPGAEILSILRERKPEMPIIAEDLGEIDQPVRDLMQQFDLPGMRLLIFAFGDDLAFDSSFLPHNHINNCIVYTGTHDNSTVRAWYQEEAKAADIKRLREYSGHEFNEENVHEIMSRMAYMSVAQLAVVPIQDILGLGAEAIMNKPSTASHNWEWRLQPKLFRKTEAHRLKKLVQIYGRK